MGEKIGNNTYKIGILCLIGIAHLPERLSNMYFREQVEIKPYFADKVGTEFEEKLGCYLEGDAKTIVGYLLHSFKVIASRMLPKCPIGGNVSYEIPSARVFD